MRKPRPKMQCCLSLLTDQPINLRHQVAFPRSFHLVKHYSREGGNGGKGDQFIFNVFGVTSFSFLG